MSKDFEENKKGQNGDFIILSSQVDRQDEIRIFFGGFEKLSDLRILITNSKTNLSQRTVTIIPLEDIDVLAPWQNEQNSILGAI